jgi:hypothetical protein
LTKAVAIIAILLSSAALGASESEWVPDTALVSRADAAAMRITLPAEFGPVTAYARYYWGVTRHGHRMIDGVLVSPSVERTTGKIAPQRVNIVRVETAPGFADGGCMLVYVEFDVEASALTDSHCSFDSQPPPQPN